MSRAVDAIIIGTGQAGVPLARRLAGAGMSVAVIERARFGGTCVNTGCIPTKAMVASARAAHVARRAAEYGVLLDGPVSVDLKIVKERRDGISGASRRGIEEGLRGLEKGVVIQGHTRFVSPHEVEVGGEVLTAPRIFINVGARAAVPAVKGLSEAGFLTNSSMMDLEELPRHLVILGGSYVGLEFGQMFRRFGSEVTILETGPRLIGREDEDVSAAIREILEAEGTGVRLETEALQAAREGDETVLSVRSPAGSGEIRGSHLLVAAGRRPNTADLGLEKAGVLLDPEGTIAVNESLETSVPGIWALGDCNGRGAFTHTSYNDYEIVAANLLDGESRRVSDRIPAYNLYIDPPLGRAGMTEAEVRGRGKPALMSKREMTRVGRAVEKGETRGFMKLLVDGESERILGAAILGVGGDEVIHALLDLMISGTPARVLRRAMHIHPTVSELLPTLAGELKPL